MDVERSLSNIYNMCDLAHDTRSQLGAQEALQRAYRVRNARLCKKRLGSTYVGLDPVCRGQSFIIRNLSVCGVVLVWQGGSRGDCECIWRSGEAERCLKRA